MSDVGENFSAFYVKVMIGRWRRRRRRQPLTGSTQTDPTRKRPNTITITCNRSYSNDPGLLLQKIGESVRVELGKGKKNMKFRRSISKVDKWNITLL